MSNCLRFTILLLISPVGFLFLGGCQKSTDWKPTDPNLVSAAVNSISDALRNEEKLKQLYADGVLPDEATLGELRRYMPKSRAKNVRVDGDTATVDVMFEISSTGEQLGPQQWTVVRVGDLWKLKDTPAP